MKNSPIIVALVAVANLITSPARAEPEEKLASLARISVNEIAACAANLQNPDPAIRKHYTVQDAYMLNMGSAHKTSFPNAKREDSYMDSAVAGDIVCNHNYFTKSCSYGPIEDGFAAIPLRITPNTIELNFTSSEGADFRLQFDKAGRTNRSEITDKSGMVNVILSVGNTADSLPFMSDENRQKLVAIIKQGQNMTFCSGVN